MPKVGVAKFTDTCERTLVSYAANASELPHVGGYATELESLVPQVKAASHRQMTLQSEFQQATRDVEDLITRGTELMTRIRAGVRSAYGYRSEKLTAFDQRPLRPRTRTARTEVKQPPAPPPAIETPTE